MLCAKHVVTRKNNFSSVKVEVVLNITYKLFGSTSLNIKNVCTSRSIATVPSNLSYLTC